MSNICLSQSLILHLSLYSHQFSLSFINTGKKDMASQQHLFSDSCLILFFLTLTTTAATSIGDDELGMRRAKRGIGDNMNCPPFESFVEDCATQFSLVNRTEAVKKEPEWDATTCCYVAAARTCIRTKVVENCNRTSEVHTSEGIRMMMGDVDKKCTDYESASVICFFEFFFFYILIICLVVLLIVAVCCAGIYLCRGWLTSLSSISHPVYAPVPLKTKNKPPSV